MPTWGGACLGNVCMATTNTLATFVDSYNSGAGWAQVGIIWNGLSSYYCTPGPCPPGHTIPPTSWGYFYTYSPGVSYYGDVVSVPSAWKYTDYVYYTEAVYTAKGEYSFRFTDTSQSGSYVQVSVCNTALNGLFHGTVAGANEGGTTGTYSGVYVRSITLYDQVLSSNQRNYGAGSVGDSSSPSTDHLYYWGTNIYDLGFMNYGSHPQNGQQLWSSSGSLSGTQYLPSDGCP